VEGDGTVILFCGKVIDVFINYASTNDLVIRIDNNFVVSWVTEVFVEFIW